MNIERLRALCLTLPHTKEDVKWEKDLCFLIGEKMFCVTGLEGDFGASFKVPDEEFDQLCAIDGIIPAPYLARYKWVYVQDSNALPPNQWEHYVTQSYDLIKSKLPKKVLKSLGDT